MSTTIPDIDADRVDGFNRMAKAVIDDLTEAARDMASRHTHQVDLLKARVVELEGQLAEAAAPQFFGLTVSDLAEVLKEEAEGEDSAAVAACIEHDDGDVAVVDTLRNLCSEVRRLRRELDVATSLTANLAPKKRLAVVDNSDLPMEEGPFVITMKTPQGRRFWGGASNGWRAMPGDALYFASRAQAEAGGAWRSAVVTLADAYELAVAASEPTGPEAA